MNDNTGHIVSEEILKQLKPVEREQYDILPVDLHRAAMAVLKGRKEGYVSLTSGGKLSRYAAQQRKKKRKTVKASRRRNRT